MANAPKRPDQRGAPDALSLTYNCIDCCQMVGFDRVPQAKDESECQERTSRHGAIRARQLRHQIAESRKEHFHAQSGACQRLVTNRRSRTGDYKGTKDWQNPD